MKIFVSTIIIFSACINDVWIKFTLAIVAEKFDPIRKPPCDRRSYRGLVLSNGLKVLLISDRLIEKSAVVMSVGVGALDDTLDVPGLANLMAIMLMKGSTKKNPTLGDFGEFLRRNGGKIYVPIVRAEAQIFSFDVKPFRLAGALEKFVHFFIKPKLSSQEILEDALNEVEEEHKQRSLEDADRIFEIEKSISQRNELYSHFYTGTRQLLYQHAKMSPHKSLINRVKKFYERWYSSNIMRLIVLGKESLDSLQKIVAPIFVDIVNRKVNPISFEFRHHPWSPESLGNKIYIPVEPSLGKMSVMRLTFPVPNDHSSYTYISYFLTRGGEGSLKHVLEKMDSCVNFDTKFVCTRGISFFSIRCVLSPYSLRFQIDHIIYLTFQYLNLLDPDDLPEWIFEENLKTFRLTFFNLKIEYEPIMPVLQEWASQMQVHPLEDILMNEYIYTRWDPSHIRDFLACLKPEKMNAIIVGPNVEDLTLDREEKYYGTRYTTRRLSEELIKACNTREMLPELQFPRPNEFLPDDFSVYPIGKNERKYPYKLYESSKYEVWFSQDQEFRTPSLLIQFQLFTSLARFGPFGNIFWSILNSMLTGALRRQVGYQASMASFEQRIELKESEIHVRIYGYSDKILVLLEKMLSIITNFRDNNAEDLSAYRFNLTRLELIRSLSIDLENDHSVQTEWYTKRMQEANSWTARTMINVASLLQFEDFTKFLSIIFRRIFIRCFIHGNSTRERAMEVVEILEKSFRSSSGLLQQEVMLMNRYVEIADGSHFILQEFSEKTTYGYSSFFQLHTESVTLKNVTAYVLAEVIRHFCNTIFPKEKDDEQNESPISNCHLIETHGIRGIMIILSSKENPRLMDRRLESFLRNIIDSLSSFSTSQFQAFKKNVQEMKYTTCMFQCDLSDIYWELIDSRHYQFDKVEVERKQLNSLKIGDLLLYSQEMLSPKSPRRRKLVMHVFPDNFSGFENRSIPLGVSVLPEFLNNLCV